MMARPVMAPSLWKEAIKLSILEATADVDDDGFRCPLCFGKMYTIAMLTLGEEWRKRIEL